MQAYGTKLGVQITMDSWFVESNEDKAPKPKKEKKEKPIRSGLDKLHNKSIQRMEEALKLIEKGEYQEKLPTLQDLAKNPELDLEWDPSLRDCTYQQSLKFFKDL